MEVFFYPLGPITIKIIIYRIYWILMSFLNSQKTFSQYFFVKLTKLLNVLWTSFHILLVPLLINELNKITDISLFYTLE